MAAGFTNPTIRLGKDEQGEYFVRASGDRYYRKLLSPEQDKQLHQEFVEYTVANAKPASGDVVPAQKPVERPDTEPGTSVWDTLQLNPLRNINDTYVAVQDVAAKAPGVVEDAGRATRNWLSTQMPAIVSLAPKPAAVATSPAPAASGGPMGAVQQAVTGAAQPPSSAPASPTAGERGSVTVKAKTSGGASPAAAKPSGYEQQLQEAARTRIAAIDAASQVESKRLQEEARIRDEAMKQQLDFDQRQAQLDADARTAFDAETKKYRDMQAELQKSPPSVDPDRFWKSRGVAQTILAGISVFLSGLKQGPNQAIGIIQKAIDDDLQAQNADIERGQALKRDTAQSQLTLLSMARQRYGDARAALHAAKSAAWERTIQTIAGLEAKYPHLADKAQELKAGIQMELAKEQEGLRRYNQSYALDAAKLGLQRRELEVRAEGAKAAVSGEQKELYVPGLKAFALDKEAAKEARKLTANVGPVKQDLEKLIEFREKHGAEKMPGEALSAIRVVATRLQSALRKDDALGTLDKGSQEFLDKLVGDPGAVGFELARLKALESSITDAYEARVSQYMDPRTYQPLSQKYSTARPVR